MQAYTDVLVISYVYFFISDLAKVLMEFAHGAFFNILLAHYLL